MKVTLIVDTSLSEYIFSTNLKINPKLAMGISVSVHPDCGLYPPCGSGSSFLRYIPYKVPRRVAIEWLPRPHKNTPTEFYMKKKQQKAQNIAV